MTDVIKFNSDIHVALNENQSSFVPKTAEQDYEVAALMAHASIEHEDRRISKGMAPYNLQMHRKVGAGVVPCLVRNKHRVLAENAADRLKMEIGANNDAVINIAKKAEKTWSMNLDDRQIDLTNLKQILLELTAEQRSEVIDSLEFSAALQRKLVMAKHANEAINSNPVLREILIRDNSVLVT